MEALITSSSHVPKLLLGIVKFKHTWIKPVGHDTGIKVYNCVTRQKDPLVVGNKNSTKWYTCGPTVYDSAHIGHASCYVKLDIIQRILRRYFSVNLVTAMNITDIDDKIINKSIQSGTPPSEIAWHYEKEFWEDMDALKVMKPNIVLRVTEYMPVIEKFIKELVEKKDVYKSDDGSLSFNIKTKDDYGKLQNIAPKNPENAAETTKVNFAVWKAMKMNEPYWNSAWGPGRPGWHTECSALASEIFGSSVDIHAGGIDLRFPHHENEEVQCCAYFSKPQWVNYWLHTGLLLQHSSKMSKSLNNTLSIRKMLEVCDADVFRIMCLMSHYKNNMEFGEEYVKSAVSLLQTFKNFVDNCKATVAGKMRVTLNSKVLNELLVASVNEIHVALCNDFDTASCIKTINSIISSTNKVLHTSADTGSLDLQGIVSLISILNFVIDIFNVFGVDLDGRSTSFSSDSVEYINMLTEFRQNVRNLGIEKKDKTILQLCDHVRNDLKKYGIVVKDHGKLSSWSR